MKAEFQTKPKKPVKFILPEELQEKKLIVSDKKNWDNLQKLISSNKLGPKDINVLRIYFTFLNMQNTYDSET